MSKYSVTFYSPGTFMSEMRTVPIDSWDIEEAVKLSENFKERYNATPYGFRFHAEDKGDSVMYYLGGTILTYDDVVSRNNSGDKILIANMRCNHVDKVIENTNSWRSNHIFADGDILINYTRKEEKEDS